MKLFELFEKDTQSGLNNLKAIVEAAKSTKPARVTLGEGTVQINSTTAKCIYDLYEQARTTGKLDKFMEQLSSPTAPIMENAETLAHILVRFPKEVKDFEMGGDLDDNLYDALFDYYSMHGEMPYGVAKARTGDPYEWISARLESELDMDPATSVEDEFRMGSVKEDSFGPDEEDIPELISMGMFESKKAAVEEGWDEMLAATKKRAEDEKGTGKFDKKKISTGTVYTRKYDDKTGETEEPKKAADGGEKEKRGRGRPRTRPESDANAPKRGRGRPRKNPLPDANAPKRGRGRPKKVREWIENLRYIAVSK